MIEIKIVNLRKTKMMLNKLPFTMKKAGKSSIKELSKRLTGKMRTRVNVWRGSLKESIKPIQIDADTIGIGLLFYGRFLEAGHILTEMKIPPKLKGWLTEKGIYVPFKAMLIREGQYTFKPHPFISSSIEELRKEFLPTAVSHTKKGLSEAGFKGG